MHWTKLAAEYAAGLTIFSVLAFIGGLVAMRYIVIYMPADYFLGDGHATQHWADRHPLLRWTGLIVKNLLGVLLLLAGIVMLVIPGPGILTMLLGLSLVDMPGKRRAERWLVSFPQVLSTINHMRQKHHQPLLELPDAGKKA